MGLNVSAKVFIAFSLMPSGVALTLSHLHAQRQTHIHKHTDFILLENENVSLLLHFGNNVLHFYLKLTLIRHGACILLALKIVTKFMPNKVCVKNSVEDLVMCSFNNKIKT